ncbi:uncharacterized protein LOC115885542 [Sitophilus oryzae]|uniref:Uncharacterized protein LOC115885542 n=1 Tax=Sitophilus oryzae TaxID=7048 RepID=A0A6J2YBR7_SITOR|nr:uncharacterized protein LOC115885542 [Sitophilus oryzae]XP_030760365.1 uncharacterized protein LOC115885542 [Sitophilus oryzae]
MSVAVFSEYCLINKLKQLLPAVNFIEVKKSDLSPLYTAEIILADFASVGPHISQLEKAKWIQGTWAGIDALKQYIDVKNPPKFAVTRSSGTNIGQLMAEYVVANIVFQERDYLEVRENQKKCFWNSGPYLYDFRSISELTIGILGIGSIGNIIGKTLKYMGATIYGYGRRESLPLENEEYQHISQYFTKANFKDFLSKVDYLINVLPSTPETNDILGNGVLENCKGKNTVFINVGRGNVIKDAEIVRALNEKWIAAAIIDVFEKEPLPEDSPLWKQNSVFLTPHVSGPSRVQDIVKQFKINYEKYLENQPLSHKVDFEKGY